MTSYFLEAKPEALYRFIRRGLLFAAPLMLWVLAVFVVDPFNYFNISHIFPDSNKIRNAAALNHVIFNMLKEKHEPSENIIIGDSRAALLPLEEINRLTRVRFSKLWANALKLNESLDLFDFANSIKPVQRAVFTLNFDQFNEFAFADRIGSVRLMIRNPLLYIFDRSVAQAGYYVVKAAVADGWSVDSTPPMDREEFWNYIATVRAREHYQRFRYPDGLYSRIQRMIAAAREQKTEITFIIVPHHADFQKRVREFGLNQMYLRFKLDMSRLGARVVDFDYVNDVTVNSDNFRDPLHYNEAIGKIIVGEVFHGPLNKGKLLDAAWARECERYLF